MAFSLEWQLRQADKCCNKEEQKEDINWLFVILKRDASKSSFLDMWLIVSMPLFNSLVSVYATYEFCSINTFLSFS